MSLVGLCYRMKWTWDDLMNQPQWFIDNLMALIVNDDKERQKKK